MNDALPDLLRQLLSSAMPYTASLVEPSNDPSKHFSSDRAVEFSGIQDGVSVVKFLMTQGALALDEYTEWNRCAIAFKNSYGEAGYSAWHILSASVDNYDGEEACRKEWDGIKKRSDGSMLTIATYFAQAKQLGWKPCSKTKEQGDPNDPSVKSGGIGKGVDPAAFTVALVDETDDEFWVDQEGKAHVTYLAPLPDGASVRRHVPVTGSAYAAVLARRFHAEAVTKVLTKDQTNLAAALLEYRAIECGTQHQTALRVGDSNDKIYVDRGGASGGAVEIDAAGWRLIDGPPVRFIRGSRGELPVPEQGGSLADFERHFNLSPDDLRRLIGFLIAVFNVSGSYPILLVDGEQGAGKSRLNDKNVALVDPPRQAKSARMSFNSKEQDLHLGAMGVHLPYFDNVSTFSAEAADALCRMSTGGGSGTRKLYTDDQYNQIVVIKPVIITCIGAPSSRPDLLSRSLRITALPLTGRRRTETAVMRSFEADRAKMIGFLFSCVSAAICNRKMVEETVERGDFQLPRMADFAEFVEGASEMLGLKMGEFSALVDEGQSAMQTEAVLGHPVGAAIIVHFSKSTPPVALTGSAREILVTLRDVLPAEKHWPPSNMFRKALSRMSVGLRAMGVEWENEGVEGRDNVAKFRIWPTQNFEPSALTGPKAEPGEHF